MINSLDFLAIIERQVRSTRLIFWQRGPGVAIFVSSHMIYLDLILRLFLSYLSAHCRSSWVPFMYSVLNSPALHSMALKSVKTRLNILRMLFMSNPVEAGRKIVEDDYINLSE